MTTKTAKDYILTGLPFVGGLAVGGYVGKAIGKTNQTLGWLAGLAFTAFGLGWSISLAATPSILSDGDYNNSILSDSELKSLKLLLGYLQDANSIKSKVGRDLTKQEINSIRAEWSLQPLP